MSPREAAKIEGDWPSVTMLVAGKDEAENIGACVESLLAQDYEDFELVIIDDRSTDGTAALARAAGGDDPRLRVLEVHELPEGWAGKNNAMAHGISQSTGRWLCMADADCRFTSPATVRVAMAYALNHKVDLLSVLPDLEMRGFWENVVQPVCGAIMVFWFKPDKVNDPAKPQAYANGAFMLFKRDIYDEVGGHAAVRDRLMEDLAFAQRVKRFGRRLAVVQGDGLVSVRMYTSFKKILNGWSRIFFGTFGTKKRLAVSLVVLLIVSLLPHVAALAGWIFYLLSGQKAALTAAIVATAAVALQMSVIYRFYKLAGARAALFWTYGLGCIMATVAIFKAFAKHRKGAKVQWRGTAYVGSGQQG